MADRVFKKNNSGIRKLLKSGECLSVLEKYADGRGDYSRSFSGFDRAKVFVRVGYKENRK